MTATQQPPGAPNGPGMGPVPPPGPTGYEWRLTPSGVTPQKRSKALVFGVAATAAISLASLGVGITALTKHSSSAANTPAVASSPGADSSAADRALCTAIAPLMAEDDKKSNAWISTGAPGTPGRDAALRGFREYTEDWADRAQDVVDANPGAHPFLLRTLQRFIDDRLLLMRNMRPGPSEKYDDAAWNDSMVAHGGPQSVCNELGVKW